MRRAKWGIGAAALIGAAWWLSNFFNVGGFGSGGGTRIGVPDADAPLSGSQSAPRDSKASRVAPAELPPQDEPETSTVGTAPDEAVVGEGGLVEILVRDRDYYLRRGRGEQAEWVRANRDAVAAAARQAPGSESGIRARIFREASAKASAEQELKTALGEVGVTAAEIDEPGKLWEAGEADAR